jgi:hypothetical protein
MLRHEQVEKVKQLLSANVSQREISRITGVSRDSVRRIFKGQWQLAAMRIESRGGGRPRVGRCRECGALVQLPCLACRLRHRQRVEQVA